MTISIEQILRWFNNIQDTFPGPSLEFTIEQSVPEAPIQSAFIDYYYPDFVGRITGWVTGEFNFEIVTGDQFERFFYCHTRVERLEDLTYAYRAFEFALLALIDKLKTRGNQS